MEAMDAVGIAEANAFHTLATTSKKTVATPAIPTILYNLVTSFHMMTTPFTLHFAILILIPI